MTAKELCAAGLLLVSACWVSCTPSMKASIDIANEKEGGASAYGQNADLGVNVMLGWTMGMSTGGSKNNRPADLPAFMLTDSAGSFYDMPFQAPAAAAGEIAIAPSIGFVQKGSKVQSAKSRENYLEGIADVQYRYTLSGGGTVYGGLGPFIAYGIGGKTGSGTYEASTFGGMDGYKRFDAGLNLGAGYMFANSLQFDIGFDLGLVDKSPDPSDYTSKSRNFSFDVGYSIDRIIGAFKHK